MGTARHGLAQRRGGRGTRLWIFGIHEHMRLRGHDGQRRAQFVRRVVHKGLFAGLPVAEPREQRIKSPA